MNLLCVNGSVDSHQFHIKDQGRVGRYDGWKASLTIRILWRARQHSLLSNLHGQDSLIPAFDDHSLPNREFQRLPPVVAAVELVPVGQFASVVNLHGLSNNWSWTTSLLNDFFCVSLRSTRNSETSCAAHRALVNRRKSDGRRPLHHQHMTHHFYE